jgi:hypothetical protein
VGTKLKKWECRGQNMGVAMYHLKHMWNHLLTWLKSNYVRFGACIAGAKAVGLKGRAIGFVLCVFVFSHAATIQATAPTPELHTLATDIVLVNDPGFTSTDRDIDKQWGLPKARFLQGWRTIQGSTNVIVAVIDTGVDATHADLQNITYVSGLNILTGATIVPGTNSDDNGHGTLITGIIAATPNNNRGIAGTNWQVSIMPIKALTSEGTGFATDVAKGIEWAVDHGAFVINLSMGSVGFSQDARLGTAVAYAYGKGAVVVAAAGNDGAATGVNVGERPVFPVCDDNGENMVIGVVATDQNDIKPEFSNYGAACIDVAAPGKRILSTINRDPVTGVAAPNAYAYASGTSMSAPFVSGLAALLKALYPEATNQQVRDRIIASSDQIDQLNPNQCHGSCKGLLGAGRINVEAALATPIVQQPIVQDGDVVIVNETNQTYHIIGGKRLLVSSFVKNQRFSNTVLKAVPLSALAAFPEGPYAAPVDGTLVKESNNPTVYYMYRSLKQPITGTIFNLRKFNFTQVVTVTYSELNSWITGSPLAPVDGTLVKTANRPTLYWVADGSLHPISKNFYTSRGLKIFPIINISLSDFSILPKGEAYY